jgi:hypothetical protein
MNLHLSASNHTKRTAPHVHLQPCIADSGCPNGSNPIISFNPIRDPYAQDPKFGIARRMNSSNSGTVKAISPCDGL